MAVFLSHRLKHQRRCDYPQFYRLKETAVSRLCKLAVARILFGAFLLVLSRYVRPLYRQAVNHWTAYFAVALGIYITFNYYVLSSDDVVVMLTEQTAPLLLVIFIGLASYGSIFLSLKYLQQEFRVKEENQKM